MAYDSRAAQQAKNQRPPGAPLSPWHLKAHELLINSIRGAAIGYSISIGRNAPAAARNSRGFVHFLAELETRSQNELALTGKGGVIAAGLTLALLAISSRQYPSIDEDSASGRRIQQRLEWGLFGAAAGASFEAGKLRSSKEFGRLYAWRVAGGTAQGALVGVGVVSAWSYLAGTG